MSRTVMRLVWRVFHPIARRRTTAFSFAGPTALILISAAGPSPIIGWAFVFWPHMDGGFKFQAEAEPRGLTGLVDALYVSVTTLTTLGYGDVTPDAALLRVVTPSRR